MKLRLSILMDKSLPNISIYSGKMIIVSLALMLLLPGLCKIYSQDLDSIAYKLTANPMKDLQKNSIYVALDIGLLSLNYERMLPLGKKAAVITRVAMGMDFPDHLWYIGGISFLFGGSKHFFEPGLMAWIPGDDELSVGVLPFVGYRYQHPKGFLLRINPIFGTAFGIFPGLSLGYSF